MRILAAVLLLSAPLFAQTPSPSTGRITGTVTDSDGKPVEGISVWATANSPTSPSIRPVSGNANDSTDDHGNFSLTGLAPGEYTVYTRATDLTVSKPVKLGTDDSVRLDVVIPAAPAISGRVLNQNKEPVLDAFVWLIRSDYAAGSLHQSLVGPFVTGLDGAYRFEKVLEANRKYYLIVERPASDEVVASDPAAERVPIEITTYYPSAPSIDTASPIILRPGERREQMDVKIITAPYFCVDGKIQIAGKPASSLLAIFESGVTAEQLARARGVSVEEGKYRVCGLTRGLYRLKAEDSSVEFSIGGSDVHGVNLSKDLARIKMVAEQEDLAPLAKPSLSAEELALMRRLIEVGWGLPNASEDQIAGFAGGLANGGLIRGSPGETRLKEILTSGNVDQDTFKSALQKIGMARLQQAPTWRISFHSENEEFDMVGHQGERMEKQVSPGDYFVDYETPASYLKEVSYDGVTLNDHIVRVRPGSSGTVKVVLGNDGATLKATVVDSEGKPVPNATALLIRGAPTNAATLSRDFRATESDAAGLATWSGVAPGDYKVLATTQTLRLAVPEDLERLLLVMFQAQDVQLEAKAKTSIQVKPLMF